MPSRTHPPRKRERADKRVVDLGLAESRARAQALILAGQILLEDRVLSKAGELIPEGASLRLRGKPMPYVSRGGLKLKHALDHFSIDVHRLRVLDVGASTGGFTDCLLQAGAAAVCAVDVGYGQLAWKLRRDPRVLLLERTNARTLEVARLPYRPDMAVCDVSFISSVKVLPMLVAAVGPERRPIVALVKPQFEVGRSAVGKGGVVRDQEQRQQAVAQVAEAAAGLGCEVVGVVESPITGPKGNVEYLLYLRTGSPARVDSGGSLGSPRSPT